MGNKIDDFIAYLFQSTLPTRGSDTRWRHTQNRPCDFNPRSPRGGATQGQGRAGRQADHFNPRSPRGGATRRGSPYRGPLNDFNPRSPRGGATTQTSKIRRPDMISIHAPHEGERLIDDFSNPCPFCISIHAPHEGERPEWSSTSATQRDFNPRSPRGGATKKGTDLFVRLQISIHAPHEGERRVALCAAHAHRHKIISIHAPHEGERLRTAALKNAYAPFQSTLPTRGSDRPSLTLSGRSTYFNPRSPRGGATAAAAPTFKRIWISIHAPHEGERPRQEN